MGPVTLAAIPPPNPVESRVHGLKLLCQVTYDIFSVSKKFPNIHALAQAAAFPGCPVPGVPVLSAVVGDEFTHPWGWGLGFGGELASPPAPLSILEAF